MSCFDAVLCVVATCVVCRTIPLRKEAPDGPLFRFATKTCAREDLFAGWALLGRAGPDENVEFRFALKQHNLAELEVCFKFNSFANSLFHRRAFGKSATPDRPNTSNT